MTPLNRTPNPMPEHELDLLMEDVLREVANPPAPSTFAADITHRSLSMEFATAAPSPHSNLIAFTLLDQAPGRRMSRSSVAVALFANLAAMLLLTIAMSSVRRTIDMRAHENLSYVAPVEVKPLGLKLIPKLPPPPPRAVTELTEPPKIKLPDVKLIEPPPTPAAVAAPKPMPVVTPAAPRVEAAAAAPKVQSVTLAAKAASVANADAHPSPVRLGTSASPVPNQLAGPAVAPVNMNRGLSGMPSANSGGGPPAKIVSLGNGSPGGMAGGAAIAPVQGVSLGSGSGSGIGAGMGGNTGGGVAKVHLGNPPPIPATKGAIAATTMAKPPQVLFKPQPVYTPEATQQHIEGAVQVKIRVSAAGVVSVVGVVKGLGHGLDESAVKCAQGIRFKPAVDASGAPIDWEGIVTITFQMA